MSTKRRAPEEIVRRIGSICLALPQVREEPAWAGVRWRVAAKTFAHVVMIDRGWPHAFAKAAQTDGPLCVLTLRTPLRETDASAFSNAPYFRPAWSSGIVGVKLQPNTDWDDISTLLIASYRRLAPSKLVELMP